MADPIEARNAERLKFFTDAVVAIAMTLLILPLLESVTEAVEEGFDTAAYLDHHGDQLFAFVLSFVIIASFWVGHERLFTHVGTWTAPLMILNIGWMLTIVFLPVATALVGQMRTDRLQIVLYVGTMLLSTLLMTGMGLVVRRDRRVWEDDAGPGLGGIASTLTLTLLFGVAMALALSSPGGIGYSAMFVLFLTAPLTRVVERVITPGRRTRP